MNKNECINYCTIEITKMWEKYGKPTDYMSRRAVYEHCKTVCMNNGYTGMCFVDIWNKASKKAHGEQYAAGRTETPRKGARASKR